MHATRSGPLAALLSTALLSTALVGAGLALAATPAHAEPLTCQGRAVTVEGDTGTDGDDVMVVGPDQRSARARGGNDLVCIRLADDRRADFFLDAGTGDDVVHNETTSSARSASTLLGAGADTYIGSDHSADGVSTGPDLWGGTGDTDKDVVATGGGDDNVATGSVAPGTPNADVISTGVDDDIVTWAGELVDTPVDLGTGDNRLVLKSGWAGDDVDIDAPAGVVTAGSRPVLRWTGPVTSYSLEYTHLRTAFTGTDLGEYVTFWPSQADQDGPRQTDGDAGLRLDADLAGGDDRLEMADAAGGAWLGGSGRDHLGMPSCSEADVRLGASFECSPTSRTRTPYTGRTDGWERTTVPGWRLEVTGTGGPDEVTVIGNRVRLDGRGGDDVLAVPGSAGSWPSVPPAVVRGGGGDDLIRGGYLRDRLLGGAGDDRLYGKGHPDVLLGGAGRDRVWGGAGQDRCSAEVRRAC